MFSHFRFFKLFNQPFYHSKTLLGISIIQQLSECEHNTDELSFLRNNETGIYTFKFYDNIGILTNKIRGGQFGSVFTLNNEKTCTSKKYFIKAYYGYPAKAKLNSQMAFDKTNLSLMTSDIVNDGAPESNYKQVDFKELFVYKFLDLIGLGPKVHFLVNQYLKDGLFIATEDINTGSEKFVEIGCLNEKDLHDSVCTELCKLRCKYIDCGVYENYEAMVDMLEVDTINRIFTLNDFNTGNLGYLKSKDDQEDAESWLKKPHKFIIIDFLPSIKRYDNYVVENIEETFFEGNTVTVYDPSSIMYAAINRKVDDKLFSQKLYEKNKDEKLFFGKKVIKRLEVKRFNGNLNKVLQIAKSEVENFFKSSINGKIVAESIGLSKDYIRDQMMDLDNYIKGILTNYNFLKKIIGF